MRDIRGDLQTELTWLSSRSALRTLEFEQLIQRLKTEQANKLEQLRAQLRLANKLLEFMGWHHNVCATLTTRIAAAEEAETAMWKSLGTDVDVASSS